MKIENFSQKCDLSFSLDGTKYVFDLFWGGFTFYTKLCDAKIKISLHRLPQFTPEVFTDSESRLCLEQACG